MNPWEDLATHWRTAGEMPVYDTLTEQLVPPCLVIMPDDPWLEPGGFSIDPERYLAYAVTASSAAASSQRTLHRLIHFMRHNLPEGWSFESAGAPSQRDHQGITYMAAETRLVYQACTGGDPYEGESS